MNRIFPFISVDDAASAIDLYKEAFHASLIGEITYFSTFEPEASYKDKIAHAALKVEQSQFFIGDAVDQPYVGDTRFTVNVELPSKDKVIHAFNVLEKDAKEVFGGLEEQAWSELGFTLRDAFGVIWLVYFRK